MTSISDQLYLSSPPDKNVSYRICDGYDCKKRATKQLTVNVGTFGEVNLNLCRKCVPKFNDRFVVNNGLENHRLPRNGI